ncbi:MAG: 30S ribosomal protein S2 [Myxococcota bacterium]|nr:30S ribosomal protein S2 [Myxococcota bacterium]
MANVSLRDLLEAGVHFGHQTRRWNPKMRPFIYGEKNGIHIIDIQITAKALVDAVRFVNSVAANGRPILFVGTKRAAQKIVAEEAARSGQFFVNHRWLGGTLTNFQTVKNSIERLLVLEKASAEGRFDMLTKKEALELTREMEKMQRTLGGIKNMKGLPGAVFVIDPKKEHIAVKEANKLGIPVVALCDTNCDPGGIAHVIPGNDDAIKSIRLFTSALAEAAIDGAASGRTDAQVVAPEVADVDVVKVSRSIDADEKSPEASAAPEPAEEAAAEGEES